MIVDAATLERNLEAVKLYRLGYSIGAIAQYQSRGRSVIAGMLRRYGVEIRPTGRQAVARNNGLPDLAHAGEEPEAVRGGACVRCGLLSDADAEGPVCGECLAELMAWHEGRGRLQDEDELEESIITRLVGGAK